MFCKMGESLQSSWAKESGERLVDNTKISLSLLEKETWVNFFKNASDWLKKLFWVKSVAKNDNDENNDKKPISESVQDKQEGQPSKQESQYSKPNENLDAYKNVQLSESVVKKARDYISNWWTFYSNSKWTITWGRGKYKHVCSTWSYNVLWQLWLPKVSNSTECDLKWKILPKMGLEYIWEVDPDNPGKNWYKPQNGDTAVWPRFNNGRKMTQHQATFINWHWVSDTIQSKMSCYGNKNEPMVKVYRYTWKVST